MEAFLRLLTQSKRHPVLIFWYAACYYDQWLSEKALGRLFKSHCELQEGGSIIVVSVPDFVEDYCVEVLSGRIKLPSTKQIGG